MAISICSSSAPRVSVAAASAAITTAAPRNATSPMSRSTRTGTAAGFRARVAHHRQSVGADHIAADITGQQVAEEQPHERIRQQIAQRSIGVSGRAQAPAT